MTCAIETSWMGHFGKTIVRLRKAKYLSQSALAVAAGVDKNTIQNIEKMDSNNIRGSTYLAVAAALGLTTSDLDREWRVGRIEQSIGDPVRRGIPLINKAPAGKVTDYHECSMIDSGQGHWYVLRDGIEDPHAFAVIVTGDSMTPTMIDGSIAVFSPMDTDGKIKHGRITIPEGHIVYVRFGPDAKREGCTVARMYRKGAKIHLEKDNKKHKVIICESGDIVNMAAMVRYDPFKRMTKILEASEQLGSKGEKSTQAEGQIHPNYDVG